ncbi:hypothetical protein [Synechococcus elongatus]|uniref:hypothetical protein n=1 Tax=Synechococcus elongatus TaxID=32046 RepID=UPI0030D12602
MKPRSLPQKQPRLRSQSGRPPRLAGGKSSRPATTRQRRLRWSVGLLGLIQLALLLWSYQLNSEAQALSQVFACLERRLNYPGTYGGTRCLGPATPLQTASDPTAP